MNLWAWRCTGDHEDNAECLKERVQKGSPGQISLNTCKLTCGKYGSLLPRPQTVVLGKQTTPFLPWKIEVNKACKDNICPLLDQAVAIMNETISMHHNHYSESSTYWLGPWEKQVQDHRIIIDIAVDTAEEYLQISTDESYFLRVSSEGEKTLVLITASTFFGARHALETLSQLIDFDEDHNSLQIVSTASIRDAPMFPYRGFILDTARNYVTIPHIKNLIKAMSYNKLNTFHWHLTDTHSFPLVLSSLPSMAYYGAYSPSQVYSPSDVRDIVEFARVRGVRVLPEFDAPSHVGHGWEWGEEQGLGKLVVCLAKVSAVHLKDESSNVLNVKDADKAFLGSTLPKNKLQTRQNNCKTGTRRCFYDGATQLASGTQTFTTGIN